MANSGNGRKWQSLVFAPAFLLAGCIPNAQSEPVGPSSAGSSRPSPRASAPAPTTPPPTFRAPAPDLAAQRALEARIQQLGRNFDGEVGIAVRDVESGWTASHEGKRLFPQQSVSKFWVALNAFQRIDSGQLDLDETVTIRREDLTLFHQPIARQVGEDGYRTTLRNLILLALTRSDNTANDAVLRRGGGPEAIRDMLRHSRIDGIRFGPGERLMQSQIAGLQWNPAYSSGDAFYRARANVPVQRRRELFDQYVADPVDGATPEALVEALSRLRRGELLSPASTELMLSIMSQTRTGPKRLTGGLAPGWQIAHKTGTGQELGSAQTGYNDIGIITAPDGRHYALAVMIGRTSTPLPTRMAMMQNVTRAAIAFHDQRKASEMAASR